MVHMIYEENHTIVLKVTKEDLNQIGRYLGGKT